MAPTLAGEGANVATLRRYRRVDLPAVIGYVSRYFALTRTGYGTAPSTSFGDQAGAGWSKFYGWFPFASMWCCGAPMGVIGHGWFGSMVW